jgi:hypothetical protein
MTRALPPIVAALLAAVPAAALAAPNLTASSQVTLARPVVINAVLKLGTPNNLRAVLRNGDENINAFTNKQCETAYTKPVFEITYY